jgi:putative ABC transport system substrate-binding protein
MNRRRFLLTSLAGALAAPLVAETQVGKVYRIGVLDTLPVARNAPNLDAFRQGLRELGYVEGQNFMIEYRSPGIRANDFPDLANELVRLKVDLILTRGTAAVTAAKNATRTIPIVMAASGDPLGTGVVTRLARPGGNVTGLSALTAEVSSKRLQLLKDAIPGIQRIVAMFDRATATVTTWRTTEQAARSMSLEPQLLFIEKAEDLGPAFAAAVKQRADAVVVGLGPVMQANVGRVVDLAARHRLPSAFASREFVDAGGLMAYGVSYPDSYRRAACVRRQDLQGRQPGRPACRAANEVRVRDQHENRQGPRPHDPAVATAAGGSGNRIVDRRRIPTPGD